VATVVFLGLAAVGALRKREIASPTLTVTTVSFIAMLAIVLVILAMGRPVQSALGVGMVLLGVPLRWIVQRAQATASA